ncbi:hypothetical protein NKW54_08535 [Acetobacter cerevisiae]|uniref:Helix-turn-helix domain-containing protein n=1 Tax=Acetobacter cerevisiae TaxID=178900 RepID=A0ABT1ERI3_9PROT|nr:hypothetical protein [Acetobacter cerevisiae]MCP1245985.1 hypothetical protein [Acetobacter cerevisiae]MCP1255703.1 hypothetical protein [Acetobacter cerevisiae]
MSSETISQSEAARRAGVSRAAIQKNLLSGRIVANGKRVDLASFDEWLAARKSMQEGVQPPLQPEVQPAAPVAAAAQQAQLGSPEGKEPFIQGLLPTAVAFQVEQNAKARLRQLEFDQKSGAVVEVSVVVAAVGKEYAGVRRKLLALPAEHAPSIHRCKTVADVQERLRVLITRALEELTADGDSNSGTAVS